MNGSILLKEMKALGILATINTTKETLSVKGKGIDEIKAEMNHERIVFSLSGKMDESEKDIFLLVTLWFESEAKRRNKLFVVKGNILPLEKKLKEKGYKKYRNTSEVESVYLSKHSIEIMDFYQETEKTMKAWYKKELLFSYDPVIVGEPQYRFHLMGLNGFIRFQYTKEGMRTTFELYELKEEHRFSAKTHNEFVSMFSTWIEKLKNKQRVKMIFSISEYYFFERMLNYSNVHHVMNHRIEEQFYEIMLQTYTPLEMEKIAARYVKTDIPTLQHFCLGHHVFSFGEYLFIFDTIGKKVETLKKTPTVKENLKNYIRNKVEKEMDNYFEKGEWV